MEPDSPLLRLSRLKHAVLTSSNNGSIPSSVQAILVELAAIMDSLLTIGQGWVFEAESVERRLILVVAERVLRAEWARRNYRSGAEKMTEGGEIDGLLEALAAKMDVGEGKTMEFGCQGFYHPFCGPATTSLSDESPQIPQSRLQFASIHLLLAVLHPQLAERCIASAADSIRHCWSTNPRGFVDALVESDERCLHFLLVLLSLHGSGMEGMEGLPDPLLLFLATLQAVHFDASVVVDWLHSEEVAIPLLYRMVKAITKEGNGGLTRRVEELSLFPPFPPSDRSKWRLAEVEPTNGANPSCIHLTVEELHGEMVVERSVRVPTRSRAILVRVDDSEINKGSSRGGSRPKYASFVGFFTELQTTLERLHRRQLIQFNASPLINALTGLVAAMR